MASRYAPRYDALIDAETWAFIEETENWYPPDTAELAVDEQRAIYDRMCRAFFKGYPPGVTSHDTSIDASDRAIGVRCYTLAGSAQMAAVVYFHGGGFVVGGLDSHDDVCAEICARTGFAVFAIDYRLAPEHHFPDDFHDAMAAFAWVCGRHQGPIVLAGDSAGGNLAAAVSAATRGGDRTPLGQVLIYPGLSGQQSGGSYVEHAEAPMLTSADMAFYTAARAGGNAQALSDPRAAPLSAPDFSNLPATWVFSAECDPLCDDGEVYCTKIAQAGGRAKWIREAGLVHGYLRARHSVARAADSFSRIVEAIACAGRGEFPG
ncbi:MAG: alpha/beta hydrolase [Pseudomonadota bacterium]